MTNLETEHFSNKNSLEKLSDEELKQVVGGMNKGELVDRISQKATVTKKQADAVLSAAIETIMEAVSENDKVTLVGFGSFE